ncbi:MAG TPA: CcmD family protein [Saprospiraceae bacterium]|nr:CcmD family protein [Saprospiraceae bacterium]
MIRPLLFTALLLLSASTLLNAQSGGDFMRSSGKIYVVVAVIVAIFVGIVAFLMYLDRKLTKLENQINNDDV